MSNNTQETKITRKNAVFPLDEKAPELLKIQMFLAPVMLIMTLSIIRGSASNVLSKTINEMGGGSFYATALLLYTLCNTCAVPIAGKLSDMIGRKRWLLCVMPVYIIAVVGCGLAPNIGLLVFFYALLGVAYGCLNNFQNMMMADLMTGGPRVRYMGFLTSGNNMASMMAPLIAGVIADLGFAQKSFVIMAPLAMITWFLIFFLLPDIRYGGTKPVIDVVGMVLMIFTIAPFTLALSQGGKMFAWTSPICIIMLVAPFFTGFMFFKHEQTCQDPLLNFKMFTIPGFSPLVGMNLFSQAFAVLSMQYMIRYCQDVLEFSAVQTGTFSTSRIISIVFAPVVATWLGKTGKYKFSLVTSGVIQLISAGAFLLFLRPGIPFAVILGLQYLYNMGIVFKQTPEVAYMSEIVPKEQRGMGLSTQALCMGLCSSVINALCALFLNMFDGDIGRAMFPMLIMGFSMQVVFLLITTKLQNIKRTA